MPKFKQKKVSRKNLITKNFEGFSTFFSSVKKKFSFLRWVDPFTYVDLFVMPFVKQYTDSSFVEFIVNIFFAAFFAILFYNILTLLFGFTQLAFPFGNSTPLVIVYSASMESTFFRGDIMALSVPNNISGQEITLNKNINEIPVHDYANILYIDKTVSNPNSFFTNSSESQKTITSIKSIIFFDGQLIEPNQEGSIIVYPAYPSGLPIIHRVVARIHALDGNFILTKGDNYFTNPTIDQDCGQIILNNPEKECITFFAVPEKDLQGKVLAKIPLIGCVKLWLVDDLFSLLTTGKIPADFSGVC